MPVSPKSFCQIELNSREPAQTLAFLEAVLGWSAVPVGFPDYTVLNVPDDCSYGISILKNPDAASGNVPYFQVDSLEDLIATALTHGAKIVNGPRLIPGYGQAAVLEEKGGVRLGFFLPAR